MKIAKNAILNEYIELIKRKEKTKQNLDATNASINELENQIPQLQSEIAKALVGFTEYKAGVKTNLIEFLENLNDKVSVDDGLFYDFTAVRYSNLNFKFLGKTYQILNSLTVDINADSIVETFADNFVSRAGSAELSNQIVKLKELAKKLKANPEKIKQALVNKFIKDKQNEYQKLIDDERTRIGLNVSMLYNLDKVLKSKPVLKPTLINKILHRNLIKQQLRKAELEKDIEERKLKIAEYEEEIGKVPAQKEDFAIQIDLDLPVLEYAIYVTSVIENIRNNLIKFEREKVQSAQQKLDDAEQKTSILKRQKENTSKSLKRDEKRIEEFLGQHSANVRFVRALKNIDMSDCDEEEKQYVLTAQEEFEDFIEYSVADLL